MSQSLPTGNFRWLSTTEVNRFDIFRIENDYKKRLCYGSRFRIS